MGHRVKLPERKWVRGCCLSLRRDSTVSELYLSQCEKNTSVLRLHCCKHPVQSVTEGVGVGYMPKSVP